MDAESTESTETYLKVLEWLHVNLKKLMIAGGVVAVIAVVFAIMAWQKSETETTADAQLMTVPVATLHAGQMVPTPSGPFLKLAKDYPDTSAGEYATLLGAEALFTEGKYPEAHEQFSKFINDNPASALLPQAKIGVAASLEAEGKIQESAQKYQEVVTSYPTEANIVSPAKLTLARLYEAQNKFESALTYYSDLARINNPYDPWVAEARERGEDLLARHPELRKQPAAPPAGAQPGGLNLLPHTQAPRAPAAPATKQ